MTRLYLYKLTRTGDVGYDEAAGFVVAARRPLAARRLAAAAAGDEGAEEWLSPGRSTLRALGTAEPSIAAGVVLCDFLAG